MFPLLLLLNDDLLTLLRKRLTSILNLMQLPLLGLGFHMFCYSAATKKDNVLEQSINS